LASWLTEAAYFTNGLLKQKLSLLLFGGAQGNQWRAASVL
jgi:hypothetical protein